MITSHRTFGLLGTATFLALSTFFQVADAADANPDAMQGVPLNGLRVAQTGNPAPPREEAEAEQPRPRQSMVAEAADGRVVLSPPEPPLDGSLIGRSQVTGHVNQVAHHQYVAPCGPVCDCGECAAEAVSGIEEIHPVESGSGIEIGCGLGATIDRLGPMISSHCGDEGCTDCSAPVDGFEENCGIGDVYTEGPGYGTETYGECPCDACTSCDVDCIPLFLPLLRVNWNRYEFFAGVQGYKGPLNFADSAAATPSSRNGSGSFGFYQGYNKGRSLKGCCGWQLAGQLGFRATQSNLSGAMFTDETRHQVFVTGGFFRRVDYGMQYGLVFDHLNQDWYFQGDATQVRGEVSWRGNSCYVWGLQFMAGLGDDTSPTTVRDGAGGVITDAVRFKPTDQYRFFYRRLLSHNGQWNAFAGWTDGDDGILGADLSMPLLPRMSLATGATYLIPQEDKINGGNQEEGWNISLGLVFRPGGHNGAGRYCRPMFDVADNGTFMIDRD